MIEKDSKTLWNVKMRENILIRCIFRKLVQFVKWCGIFFYKRTNDSKYIRSLKNTCNGQSCFIVGNGPSLIPEDLEKIKGNISFASNGIYKIFNKTEWRPDYYFICDKDLVKRFISEMKSNSDMFQINKFFYGGKVRNIRKAHKIYLYGKIPIRKKEQVVRSISEDVSEYFTNATSVTFVLLEMAIYMGFSSIYLLGVDNTYSYSLNSDGEKIYHVQGKSHFEGGEYIDNKRDEYILRTAVRKEALDAHFEYIKNYAQEHGIKIMNCTRGGILEVFERMDLDALLNNDNLRERYNHEKIYN